MTDESPAGPIDAGAPEVAELLARQAQLGAWIAKLDDEAGDVPAHVAARVRADYEGRLREVVDRLGAHRDAVGAEVERLRESLRETRDAREHTADELAEGRLRHRLGEWTDAEWEARRGELERAAEESSEREAAVAAELARYEELLEGLDAGAAPPPEAPVEVEPAVEARPGPAPEPDEAEELDEAEEPDDDLAFLDRALAVPTADPVDAEAEEERATRPGAGIKCPECGYTNDATAWFCGVCGVDLV